VGHDQLVDAPGGCSRPQGFEVGRWGVVLAFLGDDNDGGDEQLTRLVAGRHKGTMAATAEQSEERHRRNGGSGREWRWADWGEAEGGDAGQGRCSLRWASALAFRLAGLYGGMVRSTVQHDDPAVQDCSGLRLWRRLLG
jgi:hypothetical protein